MPCNTPQNFQWESFIHTEISLFLISSWLVSVVPDQNYTVKCVLNGKHCLLYTILRVVVIYGIPQKLNYMETEKTFWHAFSWLYEFLKVQILIIILLKFVPKGQDASIDSDNGLAPNRRLAIIWTNDGLGSPRIHFLNYKFLMIKC